MGAMRRKRRKRLAKEWAEFQASHLLTDECLKQARSIGYSPTLLKEKLDSSTFDEGLSVAERIGELHRVWRSDLEKRQAENEAGERKSNPKKNSKQFVLDPEWVKAKKVCRLNMEDIRMAKELGMKPKSLMKNVPSPTQKWKAPVKFWIRELYEQRFRKSPDDSHDFLDQDTAHTAASDTDIVPF